MTQERQQPRKKPALKHLELNRETVQELTETEAEEVAGGAYAAPVKTSTCPSNCVGQTCAKSPCPDYNPAPPGGYLDV